MLSGWEWSSAELPMETPTANHGRVASTREKLLEAHEAHEIGDTIAEVSHEPAHEGSNGGAFRRRAGVILGVIAMLLAIASLLGEAATKETINFNILASDTYSFYQAKNARQNALEIADAELVALTASHPDWSGPVRDVVEDLLMKHRAAIARDESNPEAGNGKKELLIKASQYEERRNHVQRQDVNYDYARAIFQIAIVLGSVSIVGLSRPLLWLAGGFAGIATLLTLNGLLLLVPLPWD